MKKIKIFMAAAAFAASFITVEAAPVKMDFAAEPAMTVKSEKVADNKDFLRSTEIMTPPTNGKSFSMQLDLDMQTYNHYGALQIELRSDAGQKLGFNFTRGDNAIRVCTPVGEILPGVKLRIKEYTNVAPGKMKLGIEYDAVKKNVVFRVRDMAGKQLFATTPQRVMKKINFDRLYISVREFPQESGDIVYDGDAGNLYFRSYVGTEGEYPYMLEGTIDNLVLNIGK